MPIYTRTGDDGTTSLFGGKRISKSDPLVDLYGSIDELNSWVGLINAELHDSRLTDVQRNLLTIGSVLAGWRGELQLNVPDLEVWIDEMDKKLPKLTNFILPGGSVQGARIHIVRNVCRRVERIAVSRKADPCIIQYLNRLSDLFFELARFINKKQKVGEVVWSGIPRRVNKQK
jgi:cob(I)alamin adenosyltransferase